MRMRRDAGDEAGRLSALQMIDIARAAPAKARGE
jgi:hypothetical protein